MRPTIAIVGAGFSGTLLAVHLLAQPTPQRVLLIDRRPRAGPGVAFSSSNRNHLLNVRVGNMSAFPDRPRHFLDWLARRMPMVHEQSFVARQTYGAYLEEILDAAARSGPGAQRLELRRAAVVDLVPDGGRHTIVLDDDSRIAVDRVVLGIGNAAPAPLPGLDAALQTSGIYRPNPWSDDLLDELARQAPVGIVGTGLTMVDVTVSLLDAGHRGPIHALSRRGYLPATHAFGAPWPLALETLSGLSLRQLMRRLRREAAAACAEGLDWRSVVDGLRPSTVALWQGLSAADRARFLRHVRPLWEVHRHRMAPLVADRITRALATGQLRVLATRIAAIEATDGGALITATERPTGKPIALRVARVINCAGPTTDPHRVGEPLVQALLQRGQIVPDSLRMGIKIDDQCRIVDRGGCPQPGLFAVGPITRGRFLESTAVPDLRQQCMQLAELLTGERDATPARRRRSA
jgi:uncharacterized NAD(P)/FAD-binding protein YdhS